MKVDPRGQRFSAALSTVALAVVLITGSIWLLVAQAAVFAVSAVAGLRFSPYGVMYRSLVRPLLGAPRDLEDAAGPRFAQGVGLLVSVVGVIGYAVGSTPLGVAGVAAALAAAFLNAAFGLCLGCELYVRIRRFWPVGQQIASPEPEREVPA